MVIAGTGHRPNKLGGYSVGAREFLRDFARVELAHLDRETKIISGMAQGWDTALAQAAVDCGFPLVVAIPFKEQPYPWPKEAQELYYDLLNKATEVVYVSTEGYATWKLQKRNAWMVDQADSILALWDGTSGGTANCIAYAKKKNRPVYNRWEWYKKTK